jgi:hypothetical protein
MSIGNVKVGLVLALVFTSTCGPADPALTLISLPVAVASVAVRLENAQIQRGDSTRVFAVALSAGGDTLSGRAVVWSSSDATVAAVATAGVVVGVGAGTASITAAIEGHSGSATLTVASAVPATAGVALPAPPAVLLDYPMPVRTGRTIQVRAGGDLQAALQQATRGDEVVLDAGATFVGNFTLPAKPGTAADGWLVVRTSRLGDLPAIGTRVTLRDTALMARILTRNASAALATAAAAHGWRLIGLDVGVDSTFTGQHNGLVLLGDGSGNQREASQVPQDLVIDRSYLHGHRTTNIKRCIALNSGRTAVTDSYLGDCHGRDFDAQAIAGWNGPGPYKIVNNSLQGSTENVMFGGADPAIRDLVPSDIEIRGNYIFTPPSWKGVWLKKNLLELKNAQRVLIEGNILDGSWAHGQVGFAFMLISSNQDRTCTWCRTTDLTIRNNVIRNVGAGFNMAGWNEVHPVTTRLSRLLIESNVVENVNTPPFIGEGRMLQLLSGVQDLTVRRNTMTGTAHNSFLTLGVLAGNNFAFENNIVTRGDYGLFGDKFGETGLALGNLTGTVTWRSNVVISTAVRGNYPPGTTFVSTLAAARAISGVGADDARVRAMTAPVADR